jgi:hypothetical protein
MMREQLTLARRGTPQVHWSMENAAARLSPTAKDVAGVPLFQESTQYAFGIESIDSDCDYRIRIGDRDLNELAGAVPRQFGTSLQWPDWQVFDSAVGLTPIVLERRVIDSTDPWRPLLETSVLVTPSKAGEASYHRMSRDIAQLSRSLLADLYGKSSLLQDIRAARISEGLRNPFEEMRGLEKAVAEAERVLALLSAHPSSRFESVLAPRRLRGDEKLSARDYSRCERRGIVGTSGRVALVGTRRETFDILEHRALAHAIDQIGARAMQCRQAFQAKLAEIEESRCYRDVSWEGRASLYQTDDMPRVDRLQAACLRCERIREGATRLRREPLVRDLRSERLPWRHSHFSQSAEYRRALQLIRTLSSAELSGFEGSDYSSRSKETWRLFEQWCYLGVVEAFRRAGIELAEWDSGLRAHLRSRFALDFKRGMSFDGKLGGEHRIRIRYEPWILGEKEAKSAGESLYRGRKGVAWSPDIVVELQRIESGRWNTIYAFILDAKYSKRVGEEQWKSVRKYEFIRSSATNAQVRCLGIIALGSGEGIEIVDDDGCEFSADGLSCAPSDRVDIVISRNPSLDDGNALDAFAEGMLRYMRLHFVDRNCHTR